MGPIAFVEDNFKHSKRHRQKYCHKSLGLLQTIQSQCDNGISLNVARSLVTRLQNLQTKIHTWELFCSGFQYWQDRITITQSAEQTDTWTDRDRRTERLLHRRTDRQTQFNKYMQVHRGHKPKYATNLSTVPQICNDLITYSVNGLIF